MREKQLKQQEQPREQKETGGLGNAGARTCESRRYGHRPRCRCKSQPTLKQELLDECPASSSNDAYLERTLPYLLSTGCSKTDLAEQKIKQYTPPILAWKILLWHHPVLALRPRVGSGITITATDVAGLLSLNWSRLRKHLWGRRSRGLVIVVVVITESLAWPGGWSACPIVQHCWTNLKSKITRG